VATRKPATILTDRTDGTDGVIGEAAFSPDGRLVAGNDPKGRAIHLWKAPQRT
jgi:hypothetical protein